MLCDVLQMLCDVLQMLCDELNHVLRRLKRHSRNGDTTAAGATASTTTAKTAADADVITSLQDVSHVSRQLGDVHAQLQVISGTAVKAFSDYCKEQSRDVISEYMPSGKFWRRKTVGAPTTGSNTPTVSGTVAEPGDYIQHAIGSVLAPVVDGMAKLHVTSQITVLSIAASALCDVWTQHILSNKIRFR